MNRRHFFSFLAAPLALPLPGRSWAHRITGRVIRTEKVMEFPGESALVAAVREEEMRGKLAGLYGDEARIDAMAERIAQMMRDTLSDYTRTTRE